MALGQIGKNSASEFFETIIYMTAYSEAQKQIHHYTESIENPILREATESAMNVAVFGGIFMIIRYEEAILEKAFVVASGLVTVLMGVGKKAVDKLKNATFRGKKLGILSKILGNISDDGVAKAQVVTTQLGNFMTSRNNQYQSGNLIDSTLKVRENVVEKERSSLMLGSSMADNYVNSLMFKLMTSSFTPNDETMIKKILGRDATTTLNVDDMNKIGSFMFTKDSTGHITGLTEQFFSLVNGLGYLHNK
ncbi:MAG: hypothetical protein PHQ93_06180 [Sulfurimonas sp.]|uniref:hypothetical protein n=1 Tax=Sulfurimonas sp. TaxID=2022749 RepID=UPI00261C1265|nr:hypothetical protein [Sulfurimonas sp.]MDD5400753.1 hypothetical protein [Sulfurimonas sp.]